MSDEAKAEPPKLDGEVWRGRDEDVGGADLSDASELKGHVFVTWALAESARADRAEAIAAAERRCRVAYVRLRAPKPRAASLSEVHAAVDECDAADAALRALGVES